MVVVVVTETIMVVNNTPVVEITGVFHGFNDEDDALKWIDNINAEWKVNPACTWMIKSSQHKSIMI